MEITKDNKSLPLLCVYSFDVLRNSLKEDVTPKFPEEFKNAEYPLFVTFKKGEDLRGCIGTFTKGNLENVLNEFTKNAAFEDSRFRPIKLEEVPSLNVGISLLVNYQDRKDIYDWEVGKNGIIIEFEDDNGRYHRGTFLPEVATEQGWDKETTLRHLVLKARYFGDLKEVEKKIKLRSYESIKIHMTYDEYKKYKEK